MVFAIKLSVVTNPNLGGVMLEKWTQKLVARRVTRGIDLLDRGLPGWESRINLRRLNIFSSRDCVLGQCFGNHFIGMKCLRIIWLNHYGFLNQFGNICKLEAEWRRRIEARLGSGGAGISDA